MGTGKALGTARELETEISFKYRSLALRFFSPSSVGGGHADTEQVEATHGELFLMTVSAILFIYLFFCRMET